jgi:predicted PurR-regulated permease PerM
MPGSILDYLALSAPAAAVQMVFALLFVFFFLAGWSRMRKAAIGSSSNYDAALATSRTIRSVVEATSAYMTTIIIINSCLGLAVGLLLWLIGMPSPWMWGDIVAICNFIPYVGPLVAAMLLALLPAALQIGLRLIEANFLTPLVLGRRLTINPLLILVSLSFWGWIWGAPGAFLAVPLLIVIQTVIQSLRHHDA